MMNQEIKAEWVAALRSGEYQQGRCHLKRYSRYCCLGVLCDIAVKHNVAQVSSSPYDEDSFYFGIDGDESNKRLPKIVQTWAGVNDQYGEFNDPEKEGTQFLSKINDDGASFYDIANLIEKHF